MLASIRLLESRFHTPNPIKHPECLPGICFPVNNIDHFFVCNRDSKNIHICDANCRFVSPADDDTAVCALTNRVVDQHYSHQPNYLPPSKKLK